MQSYVRAELPPVLTQYRTVNMLADIGRLPKPPKIEEVVKSGTLDINNIQHDILIGKLKPYQQYNFFTVEDVKTFKTVLRTDVYPLITSVAKMIDVPQQPQVALNIAFSQTGLHRLGVTDDLQDAFFSKSQFADAHNLGDPGTENWKPAFTAPSALHGMFLAASDDQGLIDVMVAHLKDVFGSSITWLYQIKGAMRPPPYVGHEMFGFVDGISQPAVEGFVTDPKPGQLRVPPGIILVGEPGDSEVSSRPDWAKGGSFLAFRELQQLVPEFDTFLEEKAVDVPGLTRQESVDLLGARMFGRWKSGAPVDLSPRRDDPELGADPDRNNNFTFAFDHEDLRTDQSKCPFHAHIRKSRPRADLITPESPVEKPTHGIMRSSIPYGGEVTQEERDAKKSDPALERGLVFVSYQSQLEKGFRFLQIPWSNNPDFALHKDPTPGWDPIVGQNHGGQRHISGYDLSDPHKKLFLEHDFVVSRGGEYLFSPSLSALHDVISA